MVCGLYLQECSRQQGPGFRGGQGESPKIPRDRFEAPERWVEFWQMEAEGGGNSTDRQNLPTGKWANSRCIGGSLTLQQVSCGKKDWTVERSRFFQDPECPSKYTNFNLRAMGTGLISNFSHLLNILTCTKGYA